MFNGHGEQIVREFSFPLFPLGVSTPDHRMIDLEEIFLVHVLADDKTTVIIVDLAFAWRGIIYKAAGGLGS